MRILILQDDSRMAQHVYTVGEMLAEKLGFDASIYYIPGVSPDYHEKELAKHRWTGNKSINCFTAGEEQTIDMVTFLANHNYELLVLGKGLIDDNGFKINGQWLKTLSELVYCPLIIVNSQDSSNNLNNIGVLINYNEPSYSSKFEILKHFSEKLHARIHLIGVLNQNKNDNLHAIQELKILAEQYAISGYSIKTIFDKSAVNGLKFLTQRSDFDLTAILENDGQKGSKAEFIQHLMDEIACPIYLHL